MGSVISSTHIYGRLRSEPVSILGPGTPAVNLTTIPSHKVTVWPGRQGINIKQTKNREAGGGDRVGNWEGRNYSLTGCLGRSLYR